MAPSTVKLSGPVVLTLFCIGAYLSQNLAAALLGAELPFLTQRLAAAAAAASSSSAPPSALPAFLSRLLPAASSTSSLSTTQLVPLFNAASAAGSALGGRYLDRIAGDPGRSGRSALRLLGLLLVGIGVGQLSLGVAFDIYVAAAAVGLQGLCDGAVRTTASWLVLRLHPPESVPPYLQSLHLASGLGRSLSGLLAGSSILLLWLPKSLGLFCFGAGQVALMGVLLEACLQWKGRGDDQPLVLQAEKKQKKKEGGEGEAHPSQFRSCRLWLMALHICLLAGVHHCMQYLLPSYALANSASFGALTAPEAARLTTSYSFSYALGRFLSIPVAARLSPHSILWCCLTCSLLALLAAAALPPSLGAEGVLHAVVAALAVALAPVHGSAVSYCRGSFSEALSGGSLSLLMLATTVGGVVLPQLAGTRLSSASEDLLPEWMPRCPPFLQVQLVAVLLAAVALLVFTLLAESRKERSKSKSKEE